MGKISEKEEMTFNRKEYEKEYYLKNKERIIKREKVYRLKNKEWIRKKQREYRLLTKEYHTQWMKEWHVRSKDKIRIRSKKYRLKNKEKIRKQTRAYYLKNKVYHNEQSKYHYRKNRAKVQEQHRQWKLANKEKLRKHYFSESNQKRLTAYNLKNKERDKKGRKERDRRNRKKLNAYQMHRKRTDPSFKLKHQLRNRIWIALKRTGSHKSAHTMELIGCTIDELWTHLESKFKPWMTRENHGVWHVDHIKACAKFDLTDPVQQRQCFHWSNLQPLWAHENLSKGSR